jgi:hypothetical protein
MKSQVLLLFLGTVLLLTINSCDQGPELVSTSSDGDEKSTEMSADDPNNTTNVNSNGSIDENVHSVVVLEVLQASNYVYLYVSEGDEEYWLATSKTEVKEGETVYFEGGFLQTNFESKEHHRTFDELYLVNSISKNTPSKTSSGRSESQSSGSSRVVDVSGSVKIADLVSDPKKYSGQTIQISGECVKINSNIMGRNWIHIKDGSKDDYDLVITSDIVVPQGQLITMTGTVALDKDFGASYKYDIIIEDGKLVQ